MYNPSNYKVGPRGGVYTVDFDGTRHYLDREQARRYIAELTAKRSSAGTATKSRLVSINPGDKDYGQRSSQSVESDAGGFDVLLSLAVLALVTSLPLGALFGHPFWLLKMPFQLLNALLWASINS